MYSILNNKCNIRDEMRINVDEENREYLYDQYELSDVEIDAVLNCAVITTPTNAFDRTITPIIFGDYSDD